MHMVNTVGSCTNKYWTKDWSKVKESSTLTPLQHSLIIGSLLGDGTMRIGRGAKNANFKVEQGLEQKAYVIWKYKILKPLVFTGPKLSFRYRETRERYPKSWWFRTMRHPLLTDIYHRFYIGEGYRTGRKIVPKDIVKDLNPFALSVWIMDDGSFNKNHIDISTYSFTLKEICILQDAIQENFNVLIRYYRDRDKGYRMYCNQKETKQLVHTIHSHIIPSMMYKIGLY